MLALRHFLLIALVACGFSSLILYRSTQTLVANEAQFTRVGTLGAGVAAVAVHGTLAYVGVDDTLYVVDVSDQSTPVPLAQRVLPGLIQDLRYAEGMLYIALDEPAALQIFDLSAPLQPQLRGQVVVPGNPTKLVVTETRAYIAAYNSWVQVVDISDPDQPIHLGGTTLPRYSSTVDVAVAGVYLYAVTLSDLVIFQIGSTAIPQIIGSYELVDMNGSGLIVDGTRAYVTVGAHGLLIIDVASPSQPTLISQFDPDGWALDVEIDAGTAVIVEREGVRVIDLQNPAAPVERGTIALPGYGAGAVIEQGVTYIADQGGGLAIVDATHAAPTVLGMFGVAGNTNQSVVVDGIAYAASFEGLQIVDVRVPARPQGLSLLDLPGIAYSVAIGYPYAYILSDRRDEGQFNQSQLTVVDVHEPRQPVIVASKIIPALTYAGLQLQGSSLYFLAISGGITQIDVSNPVDPQLGQNYDIGEEHWGGSFFLRDNLAYIIANPYAFQILDLSTQHAPTIVNSLTIPGAAAVTLDANMAYVTSYEETSSFHDPFPTYRTTIHFIDINNPEQFVQKGQYSIDGYMSTVAANNGLLYLGEYGKVSVIDVHNPARPALLATFAMPAYVEGITFVDDLIYVTGYRAGLHIYTEKQRYQVVSKQIIGATTLTSADATMQLSFAANSFATPVTVFQMERVLSGASSTERTILRRFLVEARNESGVAISEVDKPYTVTVDYSEIDFAGRPGARPGLAYWNGTAWVDLPPCHACAGLASEGIAAAQLDRFAEIALVADSSLAPTATPTIQQPTNTPTSTPTATATPPPAPQDQYYTFVPLARMENR
jgi:hypothetical protein